MQEPLNDTARRIYDFFMSKLDYNRDLVQYLLGTALIAGDLLGPDEFFTQLVVYCRLFDINPHELLLCLTLKVPTYKLLCEGWKVGDIAEVMEEIPNDSWPKCFVIGETFEVIEVGHDKSNGQLLISGGRFAAGIQAVRCKKVLRNSNPYISDYTNRFILNHDMYL
jgi:hypothetical protein